MKRTWWITAAGTGALIVLTFFLAGCEQKSVNQILAEPNRYRNHDVTVVGVVTESASLLGHGAYQVDDGTGRIWVVSGKGTPRKGARVAVRGKIRDVIDVSSIMRLPGIVGEGLVLVESQHKARY